MGRILALGILGTASRKKIGCLRVPEVPKVPTAVMLALILTGSTFAGAQSGSITGTITTMAKGGAPLAVTIDQQICGNELPDEAIVVEWMHELSVHPIRPARFHRAPAFLV